MPTKYFPGYPVAKCGYNSEHHTIKLKESLFKVSMKRLTTESIIKILKYQDPSVRVENLHACMQHGIIQIRIYNYKS